MNGTFSDSVNTLGEILAGIPSVDEMNWAISLQSGPFRETYFTDDDDPRNVLHLFHEFGDFDTTWFKPGILPNHATDLVIDEWSYYLGFYGDIHDAKKIWNETERNISPRQTLFEFVATIPCIYIVYVDEWWWELYARDAETQIAIEQRFGQRTIDSSRWDGAPQSPRHPFPGNAR